MNLSTATRAVISRIIIITSCVCATLVAATPARAQVSLYTVVDQALRNSNQVKVAEAEVRRAEGAVTELRDAYIPNLSVGSGLGYSYGFTINPPTIYNINSQSLLFSFSQHDYIRAARAGLHGAQMHLKDVREQVILDTAQTYLELDELQQSLAALQQEHDYSDRLSSIVNERFNAGLESKVGVTKTRLDVATVNLKELQVNGRVRELEDHLARITGLPSSGMKTDSASIPPPPQVIKPGRSLAESPAIMSAEDNAIAKQYQAFGAKRDEYRPQAGLAAQYNRYSTLSSFQQTFPTAKADNFAFGLQLNWPLLDQSRRAKRVEAEAEASRARSEFNQYRDQAGEQTLKLQDAYEQLAAQEQVARLTAELSQDKLEAVLTQANANAADGTPLTPKDEQSARIDERQRYIDALDAKLQLAKMQLEILRLNGGIEAWARSSVDSAANSASK